ncbi:MAG: LON peptidase substrate-binding domain-containing protein [Actinomycetota bacterium]|jgi:Lon protease-like protein|nr:LON peptidase substrate-binding domain-containing protein [Actinomycetota bacterium]
MSESLPLFPLGTVLFPGLVLPLHIFEDRYRQLVRDLLDGPEPRRFGVIAIREGRETGITGVTALHEIGCVAEIREVTPLEDGEYDLVTLGTERFRLHSIDESLPYLRGEVEMIGDPVGDEAEAALVAQAVGQSFTEYLDVIAERGSAVITVPELPTDPAVLSYLVAAAMVLDLPERQGLLAQPDTFARLRAERGLLAREIAMLKSLGSTPAPDLRSSPYSPN